MSDYTSLQNLTFSRVQKVLDLILGKSSSLILNMALVFQDQVKFGCRKVPVFYFVSSLSLLLFWCRLVLSLPSNCQIRQATGKDGL